MKRFLLTALAALFFCQTSAAQQDRNNAEAGLFEAINSVANGDFEAGKIRLQRLIARYPDFKLAALVSADLHQLQLGKPSLFLGQAGASENEELAALYKEFKHRSAGKTDGAVGDTAPSDIVYLSQDYEHVLVSDLSRFRFYVYRNTPEGLRLERDFYAGMGQNGPRKRRESDLKTPLGVYFINSYLDDRELPDLYGAGAFPLNYPNAWDRRNGYTGHGIWVHGTRSGSYNRPPLSSEGCITLSNQDFSLLKPYVNLDITPVVIGSPINWSNAEKSSQNQSFVDIFANWQDQRQLENPGFSHSKLSILRHPEDPVMVVTFLERRRSHATLVRQYWELKQQGWTMFFDAELRTPERLASI